MVNGKKREPQMIAMHETSEGVMFAVKVHPRAKRNGITGEIGDALKLSITSPPVNGRANDACIEFFAKLLKVPRSSVTIASGQASRGKVIRVSGLSATEVRNRVGI
jgi:uncharacterized protein (TIGR00251 family)